MVMGMKVALPLVWLVLTQLPPPPPGLCEARQPVRQGQTTRPYNNEDTGDGL